MKKYKYIAAPFFNFLLFAWVLICFTTCKKNTASKHSTNDSKFSFSYKGVNYVLPYKNGNIEWAIRNNGFYLNRQDIFNGVIEFIGSDCAYFVPNNGNNIKMSANCQLTMNGAPIDSAVVYLYQSGSFLYTYKTCHDVTEKNIFTGFDETYSVCDAGGTFDLVLKNKDNKTIIITEGKFEVYSF